MLVGRGTMTRRARPASGGGPSSTKRLRAGASAADVARSPGAPTAAATSADDGAARAEPAPADAADDDDSRIEATLLRLALRRGRAKTC